MMLTRWDGASELVSLHNAMDSLFHDAFGMPRFGEWKAGRSRYVLPLDVAEVEGGYRLQAPLPGFSPEQVEVTFDAGVLTIEARRSEESSESKDGVVRRELLRGDYRRRVALPADVDGRQVTASLENGLLTVTVPAPARAQPLKIAVSAGKQPEPATA